MKKRLRVHGRFLFAASLFLTCLAAAAAQDRFDERAPAIYGTLGSAVFEEPSTYSITAGLMLPWAPGGHLAQGPHRLYWDLFVSNWSGRREGGGRDGYWVAGAILTWRYQLCGGASPWFVEAGIGASVMDRYYDSPSRRFSTRFQFTEVLGLGRHFGAHGRHEVAVRAQHFSNADIDLPNPGLDFLGVRYAYRF